MNPNKIKAVFFILVFLLILALVVHWALELDIKKHTPVEPEDQQTEITTPPENPAEQVPVHETPEPQTVPTPPPAQPANPTPAPTPAPTPEPAPTPNPTPEPVPAGQNLGSGSFSSDTGTGLDLICDWSAVSVEGNKAEITLTIGARSGRLSLNEWQDNIGLRVGSQTATMTQPALDYDGGITTNIFGSKTFTVDLAEEGNSVAVAVEWHFGGVYHQEKLDVIECGGTITLTR